MEDQTENRVAQEHQELAVLVAYTQDDYIRANGTDHGSAQAIADAIQAAGFTKDPVLSEAELELLRLALKIAMGQSRQTVRGGSYRRFNRGQRQSTDSARTRRYRVLLEKLGGPKIPVAPVEDTKVEEPEATELPAESSWEREKKRRREISRLHQSSKHDPYWRYRNRLRGVPQEPVGDHIDSGRSDDAQKRSEAVGTAAGGRWVVFSDRNSIDDGSEDFAHSELFGARDSEDRSLEYGIANMGDLEDVITEYGAERSSLKWAQSVIQPSYGDLLVARHWNPPKISA